VAKLGAEMSDGDTPRYIIAEGLTLDTLDERAFLNGAPLALSPKPFALLRALMASPQTLVTKDALFDDVWDGLALGDAVLTTAVKEARQALGDSARAPRWIETVHGRGYRFLKPARPSEAPPSEPTPPLGATAGERKPLREDIDRDAPDPPSPGPPPTAISAPAAPRKAVPGLAAPFSVAAVLAVVTFFLMRPNEAPAPVDADAAAPAQPLETAGVLTPPEKSIAVLPFTDMSPEKDQSYFSDGVAEEILNALVGIEGLQVAGRTSSFVFKESNQDLRAIGEALNVAHVLEGSVRKQGDDVRITAQLVHARTGFHLWSASYDGGLGDIFDLQERIARSVAEELAVILEARERPRLAKKLTDSREAYDLLLQARALLAHRYGEDTLTSAVALLDRAIALDPAFAEAWAEIARANLFLPQYAVVDDPGAYMARAEEAAAMALKLDPSLARAHLAAAGAHSYRGEFLKTHESLTEAARLDPNDPDIIGALGYYWSYLGHTDAAIPLLAKAAERDPYNAANLFNLGIARMNNGELDAAERLFRRSVELGYTPAAVLRPHVSHLKGEHARAVRQFEIGFDSQPESVRLQFGPPGFASVLARAFYGEPGPERDRARAQVRAGLEAYLAGPDPVVSIPLLAATLQIGAYDLFMETFAATPFTGNTFFLTILWDDCEVTSTLRRQPEFPAFAERIGLAAAWRSHGWPDRCAPAADGGGLSCR